MRFVGIDPATTTGFVALDEEGNVLVETDVRGEGKRIPGGISTGMLVSLENKLYNLLQPGDIIAIEQPAVGTQMAVTAGMIHGGLRSMIFRKGLTYDDVNPQRTKKFVNRNQRVASGEKKKHIAAGVLDLYGYQNSSDNVTDAYILARIAMELDEARRTGYIKKTPVFQYEVIAAILEPDTKSKPKSNKRQGKPSAAGSRTQNTEQTLLF
jgi:crossover junction endodeoxyribonuclease RuvC